MRSVAAGPPMGAAARQPPGPGVRATILCIAWTLATGVLLGVKSVVPGLGLGVVPMQVIQPLHTLGAVGLLLGGIGTLALIVIRRAGGCAKPLTGLLTPGLGLFMSFGAAGIIAGKGSGLEYMSWPRAITVLPVALLCCIAWVGLRNLRRLSDRSPEGAWLLLMGACLAPLGMIERAAAWGETDPTRALMIEWHALDTVFAGFNTALYGLSILSTSAPGKGRPLRGGWMYTLAIVALLSTFGHHHYASGQPMTLKWIALAASLLGLVSFTRHILMIWRSLGSAGRRRGILDFSAGAWTAFAIGSGVLLAIPPINHLLHGTHAIVGHSMGAIIGVNVLIILAGMLWGRGDAGSGTAPAVRRAGVTINVALTLVVVDLFAAGVCKGLIRVDGLHGDDQWIVRVVLAPLPLLGLMLSVAIGRLCVLAWSGTRRDPGAIADARGSDRWRAGLRDLPESDGSARPLVASEC